MRPQTILIGFLALVLSGAAAAWTLKMSNEKSVAPVETVPVVIAVKDMARGGMITADMVKVIPYPKDLAPLGGLSKVEDAVDRTIGIPVTKDEPMLESKLSPKGSGRGMASLIPKGMRAFTIQTPTLASGVAGFILPGNQVDVLLTVTGGGDDDSGGGSTTTLLQKVEVLAVDQRTDAPAENKMDVNQLRSVTLVVSPAQAQQLDLGQNRGTLHLSLRNPEDDVRNSSGAATLKGLQYQGGKAWDVRAKLVLDSLAKVFASMPAPAPVVVAAPAPAPVAGAPEPEPVASAEPEVKVAELPRPIFIRTIRGTQEGGAYYYPSGSTQVPR